MSGPGDVVDLVSPPFRTEGDLAGWLAEADVAIAMVVAGHLVTVGRALDGRVVVDRTDWDQAAALAGAADDLVVAGAASMWRLVAERVDLPDEAFDCWYLPRRAWIVGRLDVTGVALTPERSPVFTSAAFSCVGTVDPLDNFRPRWAPPWITALAAEDRCHLSGLALGEDGEVGFVTAYGATDRPAGWRSDRAGGGVVVDVRTGEVVVDGRSLPRAPRCRGDQLFLCEAGRGRLLRVPRAGGGVEPVAELPALTTSLALVGDRWAVVGAAPPSDRDLPVPAVADGQAPPSLAVVDLDLGVVVATLHLDHGGDVLDVAVLPGRRPRVVAPADAAAQRLARVAPPAPLEYPADGGS